MASPNLPPGIPLSTSIELSLGESYANTGRSIVCEFGANTPPYSLSQFYRGGTYVPTWPTNAGVPTTGAISMSGFLGSENFTAVTYDIQSPVQNLNLLDYATSPSRPAPTRYEAGNPSFQVTFVIPSSVYVGSTQITSGALVTGTDGPTGWAPDLNLSLQLQGAVVGRGGAGGNGGFVNGPPAIGPWAAPPTAVTQGAGQDGGAGGPALIAQRAITINNQGYISGGAGGGGGGGGSYQDGTDPTPLFPFPGEVPGIAPKDLYGGGGGGGAGVSAGSAGQGQPGWPAPSPVGAPGSAGSISGFPWPIAAGGAGGAGVNPNPSPQPKTAPTGDGGAGGEITSSPALVGTDGQDSGPVPPIPAPVVAAGGSGGAGGAAVKGDSSITWQNTGNRYGSIQPTT